MYYVNNLCEIEELSIRGRLKLTATVTVIDD